ncbi:sterol desaturase family protein [Aspergillus vadensis CBS 113365]|uniref:Fatty acid hydroxylase superfamily protein n=1 Tax=Aspergillus vadensis (strain CBS 113365 / IMI 142717 / IBT 24658) TaxID=1448311 RepID=A0A319BUN6_ASPVC|nr:fatty acid hydroxylase superfamily protein [Aspergillus vadensis CBS 113365]PYH75020.1 fatty acid hydroxylase superfamily protein [Aspergillus vadensis CBS 113365]
MTSAGNPKDSMKSTWRTGNRDEWGFSHWLLELLNVHPIALDQKVPVHSKQEKLPYMPQWSLNLWVLFYAAVPLAINQAYISYMGHNLGPFALFNLYFFSFNATVIHQVKMLRRLGHTYGFLDGDQHERDGIPDVGVRKVTASLYKTTGSRLVMAIYLSYYNQAPMAMDWTWLPLMIGLYGIVLDFWFYWYHRIMHDVSFLWKYHRTHHLTKHPNPLLAAYADHEQEFFDMVGVPFMTYMSLKFMGLPMGFYEWWICHQYVAFAEVFGHSGLRVHMTVPSTLSWLLQWMNAEIVIEDHDLHHRKGWRKSHNYGKQTRLWDQIFGTCHERIESAESNVDYTKSVYMPLF